MKAKGSTPKTGLWILLYMLIFTLSQQVALLLVIQNTMSKSIYSYEKAAEFVMSNHAPLVMALSALIGLPMLFLIINLRKQRWQSIVLQKSIKASRIISLILIGILINQIASIILYLLQLVPFLKDWFNVYNQSMLAMTPNQDPRQLILLLGIVVPIYEEVLFRGVILREFATVLPLRWAIFAQALLFGVWHSTLIQGVYAFILAIIMARLYLRHQSIWASCAVHCGFNSASYLLLYLLN